MLRRRLVWMSMRPLLLALLLTATALPASAATPPAKPARLPAEAAPPQAAGPADPYLWLENVDGKRSLAWVDDQNARSLKVLEGDPRYAGLHAQALDLAEAKDRIPRPEFIGGEVFNFWQDSDHVRRRDGSEFVPPKYRGMLEKAAVHRIICS